MANIWSQASASFGSTSSSNTTPSSSSPIQRPKDIDLRSIKSLSTYINTLERLGVDNLHYHGDGVPCPFTESIDICRAQLAAKYCARKHVSNIRVFVGWYEYSDHDRYSLKSKIFGFAEEWRRFQNGWPLDIIMARLINNKKMTEASKIAKAAKGQLTRQEAILLHNQKCKESRRLKQTAKKRSQRKSDHMSAIAEALELSTAQSSALLDSECTFNMIECLTNSAKGELYSRAGSVPSAYSCRPSLDESSLLSSPSPIASPIRQSNTNSPTETRPSIANQCDSCDGQRDRPWHRGMMLKTCSVCELRQHASTPSKSKATSSSSLLQQHGKRQRVSTAKLAENEELSAERESSKARKAISSQKRQRATINNSQRKQALIEYRGDTDSEPEEKRVKKKRAVESAKQALKAFKGKQKKKSQQVVDELSDSESSNSDSDVN